MESAQGLNHLGLGTDQRTAISLAENGKGSGLIIAKIIIKPLIRVEFTPTWAGLAVEIKAGIHLVGQGVARRLRVAGNAAIWTIGAAGEFNTCKNRRTAKS